MRVMMIMIATAILAACATPPQPVAVENTRTYDLPKDVVWERLLDFFTSQSIPIKTIEKDSGVVYAERAGFSPGQADCGASLLNEMSRMASLNVFVRQMGGETQVTVNTAFNVVRSYDRQVWTAECYSTGLIERQILQSIAAAPGKPAA